MTYVIAEPCVDVLDRACVEECPVDCIYEGDRMLLHPPGRVRATAARASRCARSRRSSTRTTSRRPGPTTPGRTSTSSTTWLAGWRVRDRELDKDDPLIAALPPMGRGRGRSSGRPGPFLPTMLVTGGVEPRIRVARFPWTRWQDAKETAGAHPGGADLLGRDPGRPGAVSADPRRRGRGFSRISAGARQGSGAQRPTPDWLSRAHGVRRRPRTRSDHRVEGTGGLVARPARLRGGSWW